MDATVTWSGKLSFSGTADTGFTLPLGADSEAGGDNDGFRPMELLLIGLAGCTGMDVISILNKKKQAVESFEVRVHSERAEQHPRVFTHLVIEYVVSGKNIDHTAVERAVELSATRYCPAQAMLGKAASMELQITIHETGH